MGGTETEKQISWSQCWQPLILCQDPALKLFHVDARHVLQQNVDVVARDYFALAHAHAQTLLVIIHTILVNLKRCDLAEQLIHWLLFKLSHPCCADSDTFKWPVNFPLCCFTSSTFNGRCTFLLVCQYLLGIPQNHMLNKWLNAYYFRNWTYVNYACTLMVSDHFIEHCSKPNV